MDGAGTVVGDRYLLLRRLGTGGMGEVWLAADRRLGDKHVAVKRLLGFRPDAAGAAQDVERARREALAASRLNHPNLVLVTDFVAGSGEPFIVMEYVEGVELGSLIGDEGIPLQRAAQLISQVAAALAEAHDAGIVHRDIKPANILITRRDVAKVADFGIARSAGDPRLTRTGFFTGTVGYLAPEVLGGAEATSASDVWSLGAVLFETVEGRPAFPGDSATAVIAAIAFGALPTPQRVPQLAPLIGRLLERDPARRLPIHDIGAELARAAGTPIAGSRFRRENSAPDQPNGGRGSARRRPARRPLETAGRASTRAAQSCAAGRSSRDRNANKNPRLRPSPDVNRSIPGHLDRPPTRRSRRRLGWRGPRVSTDARH